VEINHKGLNASIGGVNLFSRNKNAPKKNTDARRAHAKDAHRTKRTPIHHLINETFPDEQTV
jgi:hypothetical protein